MNKIVQEDVKNIVNTVKKETKALEGKTLLISGGAGFLGSYMTAAILKLNSDYFKKPCRVVIMDNYITSSKNNSIFDTKDPNVTFINHDVRLPLPKNIEADFIIHAAGLASPYYYRRFPLETIEVAVNGTRNFLDFAKDKSIKSMLYFSSSEVYGDPAPNAIPTPETYWGNISQIGPRACYDESKRLGETLCKTYLDLYKIPVKVVRPFNVYGPGMRTNDYRAVPTFVAKAMAGEALPVHDKGNQTRTFCYISDATQGFLKILLSGKNGDAYNIGMDKEEVNMVSLANIVSGFFPAKPEVRLVDYPVTYPAGEPQRRCPDLTKARNDLNYRPKVTLKKGLARTIGWFQDANKEQNVIATLA